MKTKTTQVSTRRNEMNHSRASVMKITGMNLLEYNTFLYDIGCALAEKQLVNKNPSDLIRMPEYWTWFRNEHHMFERALFRQLRLYGPPFESNNIDPIRFLYEREMAYMIEDCDVKASFQHFLKTFS